MHTTSPPSSSCILHHHFHLHAHDTPTAEQAIQQTHLSPCMKTQLSFSPRSPNTPTDSLGSTPTDFTEHTHG
ncbi:hypothetical protein LOK49_LG08G03442 [Camellia lanceoleosa]|uniref:Uncharacterized protein n=1 Tax=Camellia lanceoleosa TaxID=1840588 RepID=A0ACC0GUQ5_9ERIC|nr:hypothetical protein LOK49_LG08G03442 [Camellia lanceoleosa]